MKLDYNSREIFFGNEALIVADMAKGSSGKPEFTNHKIVTGLVSVGSMEDQAETNSYPADDVPDHGVKKGATLLQGEMVFIQTDQALKEDILGQQRTANGLGWSPTGNWKTKCVQYLIKGRKRDKVTGEFVDGYRVVVYPHLTPTAEATKESETDSVDGVDPIQWTLAVQATDSDIYLNGDKKVPAIEYEIWGEQAKDFVEKMEAGLFIMQPDTELAGAVTLVAPVIANIQTKTKGRNDGTIVLPDTLKNSKGQNVKVTSVVKDAKGNVAINNGLAPNVYIVTLSAEGYADVSAGFAVTDKTDVASHVAFSYSERGGDRFTTLYPNLNLLTDSKDFKNKAVVASEATTSITSPDSTIRKEGQDTYLNFKKDSQSPDWFRAFLKRDNSISRSFPNVDVKPNSQYTFSVWLKGTGKHTIVAYDGWTIPDPAQLTITLTSTWTKYALTVNSATAITAQEVQFFIRSDVMGSEINLKNPKVEQGSLATTYMPSAREATVKDYPSYIGTYTDNKSNEQSADPARYNWKKIAE